MTVTIHARWGSWGARPKMTYVVDRFPEGTVYRFWFGWWFVRFMVPTGKG
jgi:hypothetical protein